MSKTGIIFYCVFFWETSVAESQNNKLIISMHIMVCFRSLGVTIWELFELGNQPYSHYSDRQVLTYAVKEQQLRLPRPMLHLPLAERW